MDNLEQAIRQTTDFESPFDTTEQRDASASKLKELFEDGIETVLNFELGLTNFAPKIKQVAFQAMRFMTTDESIRTDAYEKTEIENAIRTGMFYADWVHKPSERPTFHPYNRYRIDHSLSYTNHQFTQASNEIDFDIPLARHESRLQLIDAQEVVDYLTDEELSLVELGAHRYMIESARHGFKIGYGLMRKAMFDPYSKDTERLAYNLHETGLSKEILNSFRIVRELQPRPSSNSIATYYNYLESITRDFNSLEFVQHHFQAGQSVVMTKGIAQFINPTNATARRTYQQLGSDNGMRLHGTFVEFEAHSQIASAGYDRLMEVASIETGAITHLKVAALAMALSDVTVSYGIEQSEWRHIEIPQTVIIPLELPGQEISLLK